MEHYDVAIIGAGVTGCAAALALSHYDLRLAVVEKAADVGFGVSKANSGIIHAGFHYPLTTMKGRLELQGNLAFDELQARLGFPFRRCGIVVAAFDEEQLATVQKLYVQGLANGVPGIELCSRARLLEVEPKLNRDVCGGLFAPGGGVIEPYRYVFAMSEAARLNGVDIFTDFKLTGTSLEGDIRTLTASDGRSITASWTVNAAGLFADDVSRLLGGEAFRIIPRKGEEYLLDRSSPAYPSRVVFPVPTPHSKGVLIIPTVEGTTMVGPTAEVVESKEDSSTTAANMEKIFAMARKMIPEVSQRDLITSFAGSRPVLASEDFFLAPSACTPRLIQAAGIQSPGLTASPAVGKYIVSLLQEQGLELRPGRHFISSLPMQRCIRKMTPEEADALYQENPAWTRIICRCEKISEAEIVNAIRHGHTTVDGIKFYTRAGMGRCQGGFCSYKILKIIARETGLPLEEITKRGRSGNLINGKLGTSGTGGIA